MYFEKIYRYIFFRVNREKALAEDLTSEIMLKAYENYRNFDHEKPFGVWIYRIAHNHLVDFYKKAKLELVPLDEEIANPSSNNMSEEQTIKIDKQMSLKKVEGMMDHLPGKQKDVLLLRYFEDMSFREIADSLDMNESNVRVTLHRAIQFLKERLQYYEQENE